MKLHDLLDVMDSQMRIEIIVTNVDAYGNTLGVFDDEACRIPLSVLRRYGDYDVEGIGRPSLDDVDDRYNVKYDESGTLCFSFKNTIQIFI